MSRRTVSSDLEGIDRIGRRGGTDIGLEAIAIHDVDRAIEKTRDVVLEACIVEHSETRLRVDLDHDVDIAVGTAVAACYRAENGHPAHAARTQIRFGSTQGRQGFATVHVLEYNTKPRPAGDGQQAKGRSIFPPAAARLACPYPPTNS